MRAGSGINFGLFQRAGWMSVPTKSFPLKRKGQAGRLCERVRKTVSVVKAGLAFLAFAIGRIGLKGEVRMVSCHAFHMAACFLEEGVQLVRAFWPMPV